MNRQEKELVKELKMLGEHYGYGHIMQIISSLWRLDMKEMKLPESAALIPTIIEFVENDRRDKIIKQAKLYDCYVAKAIK